MTNLGSLRLTYNFTTLINAQSLIQYNDRTRRWSTNLRFNWQRTAATGLYVVYNDTEGVRGARPGQPRVHHQVFAHVRRAQVGRAFRLG